MKTTAIWIAVFAGTFAFLFFLIKSTAPENSDAIYPKVSEITAADRVLGNSGANVTVVEYGDYQCPGCAAFDPVVKKIMDEFGDRIRLTYRHFPLPNHKHAVLAAQFAEAAGMQGKFWEMSSMIFEKQNEWSDLGDAESVFLQYARDLGLDVPKIQGDIDADAVKNKIEDDRMGAQKFNVNSTPTFFLNGKPIKFKATTVEKVYDEFKSLIEGALGS